jgi:hypothetical protein
LMIQVMTRTEMKKHTAASSKVYNSHDLFVLVYDEIDLCDRRLRSFP